MFATIRSYSNPIIDPVQIGAMYDKAQSSPKNVSNVNFRSEWVDKSGGRSWGKYDEEIYDALEFMLQENHSAVLAMVEKEKESSQHRRKLAKQSTDRIVEKALSDNFCGLSAADACGPVINGLTFEDKRKAQQDPSSIVMGAAY